jgi:hypothetical protein
VGQQNLQVVEGVGEYHSSGVEEVEEVDYYQFGALEVEEVEEAHCQY